MQAIKVTMEFGGNPFSSLLGKEEPNFSFSTEFIAGTEDEAIQAGLGFRKLSMAFTEGFAQSED